jgi:NDP-sugar pyrophosphorylase family protein
MTNVAAILVGGKGTRLKPLVADVPKPLANVAGEPFLFLILRELASVGIRKVVLLTGYMHEKIVEACGHGQQFGLEIIYSQENEPLGTAGALKHAQSMLQAYPEFILLNGDTYLDCSLKDFIQCKLKDKSFGMIGVTKPDDVKRYGSVVINQATQDVEEFREKDNNNTGWVSAGIYKLSSRIFDLIPEGQSSSLETDIFPHLVQEKMILQSFLLEGMFCDIGVPESYAVFNMNRILNTKELNPAARMLLANMIVAYNKEIVHD